MARVRDDERHERVRRALQEAGLDALVCRLAEHVVLLTGYYPNVGASVVVFPAEGEPVLLMPRMENDLADRGWVDDRRLYDTWQNRYPSPADNLARLLREAVDERGLRGKAIGYEGGFETIAPNCLSGEPTGVGAADGSPDPRRRSAAAPRDATDLLYAAAGAQDAIELDRIRIANEVATLGLRAFKEHAVEGAREVDVSAAVEGAIRRRGCRPRRRALRLRLGAGHGRAGARATTGATRSRATGGSRAATWS